MWRKGSSSHFLFLLFCGCFLNLFPFLGHGQKFEIGLSCFFVWENVVIIFLPTSIRLKKEKHKFTKNKIKIISHLYPSQKIQSDKNLCPVLMPLSVLILMTCWNNQGIYTGYFLHQGIYTGYFLHKKHPICNLECLTPSSVWIFLLFLTFCGISFSTLAWDSSSPWSL